MSEQEVGTVQEEVVVDRPDITRNLWWEDVRIGMRTIMVGVGLFAFGALIARPLFGDFLGIFLTILGALGTFHGILLFQEIPTESGSRVTTLGMLGCLALCYVACLLNYFNVMDDRLLTIAAVILGAMAHIFFIFTVMGIATYLKAGGLFASSSRYFFFGGVLSATFAAIYIFGTDSGLLMIIAKLVAFIAAMFVILLAYQTARTIKWLKDGIPVSDTLTPIDRETYEEADVYAVIAHPSPHTAFKDDEWENLEKDDRGTAKVFVGLMTGIFCIGVIIYTVVLVTL